MNLFFDSTILPPTHTFKREESLHIVRVLRLREGDPLHLTDGKGTLHLCVVTHADPNRCAVQVQSTTIVPQSPHTLHVAISPTKQTSRFEWFLEKATEIGITEITPMITAHSERTALNTGRLQKILLAAMKQSLRSWMPILNEPQRFEQVISRVLPGQKFIAYCVTGSEELLPNIHHPGNSAHILIGPEGDFSREEVELASKKGFIPVSLGSGRLRTETAGIFVCAAFQLVNRSLV